jgi:hypothetical protein
MTKIRELRWQSGPVIPEGIRHDTLSPREREYFAGYSRLLGAYCQDIDVELTSDLEVCEIEIILLSFVNSFHYLYSLQRIC